jgi:hypothetical protein
LWAPFDTDLTPSSLGVITSWDATDSIEWSSSGYSSGSAINSNDSGSWTAKVLSDGFAWNDYDQQMYVYRKIKRNFDITNFVGDESPLNWKEFRIWTLAGSGGVEVNMTYQTGNGSITVEHLNKVDGSAYGNQSIMVGPINEYFTSEFYTQSNSIDTNLTTSVGDGVMEYYVNGERAAYAPYNPYGDERVRTWKMRDETSGDMTEAYFIHGVQANNTMPEDSFYSVDDVYVDTTWARVMVGNASTLANSTHREIQIPSAWSDTEITVTYNQGSFANQETCYLFVVDSDGTASAGYEGYFQDGTFYGAGTGPARQRTKATNIQFSGSVTLQ